MWLGSENSLRNACEHLRARLRKHVGRLRLVRQSRAALQALFDGMADGLVIVDSRDATLVDVNPALCRMLGRTRSELVGQPVVRIVVGDSDGKESDSFERLWSACGGRAMCLWCRRGDGSRFPVEISTCALCYQGRPCLAAFLHDITERKDNEEELLLAKDSAENANRELATVNRQLEEAIERANQMALSAEAANCAKSAFLANMSHEIRTPMTAIMGFTENLSLPDLSADERHSALSTIRRNGEHLLQVINDILDISKIEAGKMEIERIACSPLDIISEVVQLMEVRAAAKNLALTMECQGPIPAQLVSDPTRLKQILVNLVGNAIKFTSHGRVDVFLSCDRGAQDEGVLRTDVIDTGIGMSEAQARRVFEPFSQADISTTRKFGGTGLGLALSKRLAELMGGTIDLVRTEPDQGTHLQVTLPTGALEGVPMIEQGSGHGRSSAVGDGEGGADQQIVAGRVLLAEDGSDNQRLISFILKRFDVEVTIAGNGQEAIDQVWAEHGQGRPFDLILMDMQMPVCDGYDATGRLRAEGYDRPIVALTAHAMATDRQRCLDAGCDDYLSKPIDRTRLQQVLTEWVGRRSEVARRAVGIASDLGIDAGEHDELDDDALEGLL